MVQHGSLIIATSRCITDQFAGLARWTNNVDFIRYALSLLSYGFFALTSADELQSVFAKEVLHDGTG